eukprot:NODE_84_length_22354_cov_0.646506.p9 type:complete len:332 gc:universal NODE_84_length_22354_cov_0.646506:11664-10669(-)
MKRLRVFEIGSNLTDMMFNGIYRGKRKHDDDLDNVLLRALAAGVECQLITGGDLEDSRNAYKIAKKHQGLYSTVGCHPTRSSEIQKHDYINRMRILIRQGIADKKVVALGEMGLDYDRLEFCDKMTQIRGFEMQLELAKEFSLPLFLHNRASTSDFIKILKKHIRFLKGGVVHSFTGTKSEMLELVDMGLYIGVNGCSLKTEENLDVVKVIPLEKLLLESDCPWCSIKKSHASFNLIENKYGELAKLSPVRVFDEYKFPDFIFDSNFVVSKPDKFAYGKMIKDRSEPCHIIKVLLVVAQLKNISVEELSIMTFKNAENLFKTKEESIMTSL